MREFTAYCFYKTLSIDLKKCTCGQNVEISKQTVFMDQSIEL